MTGAPAADFLLLAGAVYGVTLAVYFAVGGALTAVNARFPFRRIRAGDGGRRVAADIRQSLRSLVGTSLCFAGGVYCQARGWTVAPLALTPWSAVLMFVVSVTVQDAWFYFGHRAMHGPMLYRWHRLHHLSVAPTAWSNDNFTVVDAISVQSYFLIIPFVLPVPPEVLAAHRLYDQVKGMIGHSGFEYFAARWARWPLPFVCTVHHDQHHETFRYNFANQFTVLDRLFGTLAPDYDNRVRALETWRPDAAPPAGAASG